MAQFSGEKKNTRANCQCLLGFFKEGIWAHGLSFTHTYGGARCQNAASKFLSGDKDVGRAVMVDDRHNTCLLL